MGQQASAMSVVAYCAHSGRGVVSRHKLACGLFGMTSAVLDEIRW